MPDSITRAHKHAAVDFLQFVVSGRIDEAYRRYVDMQGKHHNLFSPASFSALKTAMIENHVRFPEKTLIVKNVLGDGELVTVHSHIILRSGDAGIAAVHVFRFRDDKIVEMWDVGQPIPDDLVNKDGAF